MERNWKVWMDSWDMKSLKSKKGSGKVLNTPTEKYSTVRRRRNGGKGEVCGWRKAVCVGGVVRLEGKILGAC